MRRLKQLNLFEERAMPKVMSAKLNPVLEIARKVLDSAPRKTLHVNEIANKAVSENMNLGLDAPALSTKLASALAANVKSKSPRFAKVEGKKPGTFRKGLYRLRRANDPVASAIRAKPLPPDVRNDFLGKAGEYAVMSELLFWGFNVSLMTVDDGINVVALKDNKYFHLQVKTATESGDGKYSFKIKQTAFDTNHAAATFYVFVMRKRGAANYAIVPSHQIKLWQDARLIAGTKDISITMSADAQRKRFAIGEQDISLLVDDFSIIR